MFKDAKVGDRVWGPRFGDGIIEEIDIMNILPIQVSFDNCYSGAIVTFTIDGKCSLGDIGPSLFYAGTTINPAPRPKRKIKKTVTVYANVYSNNSVSSWEKESDAKRAFLQHVVAIAVPCIGEYEVEE